ncbi:hypothetical protein B0T19DRAFT_445502 [Cercophora scortea]|uniref:Uncharacterized protein n=1 Tax=Cercophora scortea TaxID=314031 RepID=A0AAE0M6H8_9PEZI|nr:hypothetical protein B0T19DRAFT_445502 [Cercophora scortea]
MPLGYVDTYSSGAEPLPLEIFYTYDKSWKNESERRAVINVFRDFAAAYNSFIDRSTASGGVAVTSESSPATSSSWSKVSTPTVGDLEEQSGASRASSSSPKPGSSNERDDILCRRIIVPKPRSGEVKRYEDYSKVTVYVGPQSSNSSSHCLTWPVQIFFNQNGFITSTIPRKREGMALLPSEGNRIKEARYINLAAIILPADEVDVKGKGVADADTPSNAPSDTMASGTATPSNRSEARSIGPVALSPTSTFSEIRHPPESVAARGLPGASSIGLSLLGSPSQETFTHSIDGEQSIGTLISSRTLRGPLPGTDGAPGSLTDRRAAEASSHRFTGSGLGPHCPFTKEKVRVEHHSTPYESNNPRDWPLRVQMGLSICDTYEEMVEHGQCPIQVHCPVRGWLWVPRRILRLTYRDEPPSRTEAALDSARAIARSLECEVVSHHRRGSLFWPREWLDTAPKAPAPRPAHDSMIIAVEPVDPWDRLRARGRRVHFDDPFRRFFPRGWHESDDSSDFDDSSDESSSSSDESDSSSSDSESSDSEDDYKFYSCSTHNYPRTRSSQRKLRLRGGIQSEHDLLKKAMRERRRYNDAGPDPRWPSHRFFEPPTFRPGGRPSSSRPSFGGERTFLAEPSHRSSTGLNQLNHGGRRGPATEPTHRTSYRYNISPSLSRSDPSNVFPRPIPESSRRGRPNSGRGTMASSSTPRDDEPQPRPQTRHAHNHDHSNEHISTTNNTPTSNHHHRYTHFSSPISARHHEAWHRFRLSQMTGERTGHSDRVFEADDGHGEQIGLLKRSSTTRHRELGTGLDQSVPWWMGSVGQGDCESFGV